MARVRRNTSGQALLGCGGWLVICFVSLLLLLLNVALTQAALMWVVAVGPSWLQQVRFQQAAVLLMPLLMLFAEWWVVELFADWCGGRVVVEQPGSERLERVPGRGLRGYRRRRR